MRLTGIGSFPGDSQRDLDEAVALVLGELADEPGLPFVPEVPGRGVHAGMVGRTLGLVTDLDVDLQPAGWRLTGSSGAPPVDQRRARSLLGQDLDTVEEQAEAYSGDLKVQVAGPWTLAATVERPRGDKVLADHAARRDLAQALALAVQEHVTDMCRRLPDVRRLVVQVDEPALPAVLGGSVPTASGFGKHRTVHPPEASEALEWLFGAIRDAGAEPWAHCCAADAPLALLRGAGARGLAADLALVSAAGHDALAEAVEAGESVVLGVVPTTEPASAPTPGSLAESVLRWVDLVGLDLDAAAGSLLVSPACGLAGASRTWARQAVTLTKAVVAELRG